VPGITEKQIQQFRQHRLPHNNNHIEAADTTWLWLCFFMMLLSIYSAFSWLPTMLSTEGLSPALAGMGLTAYNFGGVVGAILYALAITRFGSR